MYAAEVAVAAPASTNDFGGKATKAPHEIYTAASLA